MNSARARRKQLQQQHLNDAVSERKSVENFQSDMLRIEQNRHDRSLLRSRQKTREEEEVKAIEAEKIRKANLKQQQEEAERLANELYEQNRRKIIEHKLRQQIRESNHDLKELERQLRRAYVAKGLAAQLQEHRALELQQKLEDQKERAEMEQTRISDIEFFRAEREKREERKKQLRLVLQDQIITTRLRKQHLYEEFLREKRFLDEIIKRIHDEHAEEIRQKMLRKERSRREMEEFKQARVAWQEQQRIEMDEENARIAVYIAEKDREQREKDERREQLSKEREALNEKMCAKLSAEMEEAKRQEELLQELYALERDEKEEQRVIEELERKLRQRIAIRIALDVQRRDQQLRKDQEAEEERRFEEIQMRMLAEKDRLDQLSDEKRRRKTLEHKRAVRELIEERRATRAQKFVEMMREREADVQEEKEREKMIEEERIRLLKEHAAALIGFLPAGILRELKSN